MKQNVIRHRPNAEAVHTRAVKGGLVSSVSFALNMGLNLIQVPLLLRFWPQETYGLWLNVGALAGVLTSLDSGHQGYVGNLLNRYYVSDRSIFRQTLTSAVRVAAVTSSIQILLTLLLCFSGLATKWLGIDPGRSMDFSLAVVIYTVGWISTGSVNAILVRLYYTTGKFVRSAWWSVGMRLAQFAAIAVGVWSGLGLVGTTLLFAGAVFAVNIMVLFDIYILYPELYPWWKGGNFRRGLHNFVRSCVLTFVVILDLVSMQGVILLVTSGLGAAIVPLFTTLRTLTNTAMQGTGFLLNPIQPDLVRYHVQREGEKIAAVFGFFWLATGAVVNGGMVAGLFIIEPVYALWTRGKLGFDRSLFGWLAAAVLVRTLAAPVQCYLTGINHLRALSVSSMARAFFTVVGVLLLSRRWSLAGVGAALFASELFGSLLLPWWFTRAAMATLGGQTGGLAPGLAASSVVLACIALAAFAVNPWFWPWLTGVVLVAVIIIAMLQWRTLVPEVQVRVLSVVVGWRSLAASE